jgi:hypothetical protein
MRDIQAYDVDVVGAIVATQVAAPGDAGRRRRDHPAP